MLRTVAGLASLSLAAGHGGWPDNFLFWESQGDAPEQIWLNYGATPDAMVVTWLTNSSAPTLVQYDTSPNPPFRFNATGNVSTYTIGDYTSGYIHKATMTGLTANTQYYYRVSGPVDAPFSAVIAFTSNPGVGASVVPYRFGVIGDLGQTENSNNTIWHVLGASPAPHSVFITGDLSYADGFQPRWDSYGRLMTPLASTIPVMVAPGNHEIESVPPFQAYMARFAGMPFPAGSPDGCQYYSYETGPAHVIILNSFGIYNAGSPQYTWLQKDLAGIDRSRTPWVLVILHAPWYNSNTQHTNDGQLMRVTLEPMLHAAGVAMVLAGHVHAYERSVPVYNNNPDPSGSVYITIGDGGNREGLYTKWIDPQPAWSAYRDAEYGHGMLIIQNSTHADWEWHRDVDPEPTVTDRVTVVNPWNPNPNPNVNAWKGA